MSKTRRDSSELEEKLKDAKLANMRRRKILKERENELQVIVTVTELTASRSLIVPERGFFFYLYRFFS